MHEQESTLIPGQSKRNDAQVKAPTLTVICHPNPARIGQCSMLAGLSKGKEIPITRMTPLFKEPGAVMGEGLADPYISREAILLRPGSGSTIVIDFSKTKTEITSKLPARDGCFIVPIQELEKGLILVLGQRVVLLLHWGIEPTPPQKSQHRLVGSSIGVVELRKEIERVGDLNTPVLLRGESGTGKELVARAIHNAGNPERPFVSVNLGAIPLSLAASEFFGSVKGSYTGSARNQLGYFRAAHGGTLFLDEIGEAQPELQVLLLRALETGEITPVGAHTSLKISSRFVAATDADLEAKMENASFKTPLFHRLAGYEISLPPLRNRLEDFGRLFMHFAHAELKEIQQEAVLEPRSPREQPWLPADLVLRLLNYSWPGNIRQLRNVVRQLIIGCRGETSLHSVSKLEEILADDPVHKTPMVDNEVQGTSTDPSIKRKPGNVSDQEVIDALAEFDGDVKAAATKLGISRGSLYLLIDRIPSLKRTTDLTRKEVELGIAQFGDYPSFARSCGISPRAMRRHMSMLGMD